MTTVNSKMPANLFVAAPPLALKSIEGGMFDFSSGQMLRGMVVSRELDQVVLEINRQLYLAQGEKDLQVGQKLDLQVVKTQPRLEFRVIADPLGARLSQSLPLLTRPFDWSQLLSGLQGQSGQGLRAAASATVYGQLQQILSSASGVPAQLEVQIAAIVTQLKQLTIGDKPAAGQDLLLPLQTSQNFRIQESQQRPPLELSQTVMRLIKNLQNQLSLLPKEGAGRVPKSWYLETRNLLTPLQQAPQLPPLVASQRQLLVTVLNQIQQHPKVSPQLAGEVQRILIQIERQVAQDISMPAIKAEAAMVKAPAAVSTQTLPQGPELADKMPGAKGVESLGPRSPEILADAAALLRQPLSQSSVPADKIPGVIDADSLQQLSTDIKQLLLQVQQGQENKQGIAPELLGRLEGLLVRLQQLPQADSVLLPGFEVMAHQLQQLISQPPRTPQGGQLGLLSQLFGFHLESELLLGKKKDALNSLKLSLLNLQKDLGEEVKEPLRRIELFQLCKAKLAEEQVTFLPLPLNELEEGYLLAEKQSHEDGDSDGGEPPLQMSLSLRLSALGNVRIDMLYEKQGLHLRLAGEDRGKMVYLQGCADELKESLEAIELQGVSFSADAQLPARQLQQRLLPDSFNMLDERL